MEPELRRAVELARRGPRHDRNPRVGCVITDAGGQVVAEGWHRGHGTAHAEADAVSRARSPQDLRGGTAWVTLEPCHHHGRTGPCTTALVEAGIARVVYAVADPNPRAAGGAEALRAAGLTVEHRPLPAAEELVRDWSRAITLGRPHVTWKVASTLDGRVAASDGTSRWITGAESRLDGHTLRSRVGAVVVGTGTALADDPALTARNADGTLAADQPLRVVVGDRPLPAGARLHGPGGELVIIPGHDPARALAELHDRGVHTVLIEGGPTLGGAFWRAGLVDEVLVYIAPSLLGSGVPAVPDLGISTMSDIASLDLVSVARTGRDLRLELRPATVTRHPIKEH